MNTTLKTLLPALFAACIAACSSTSDLKDEHTMPISIPADLSIVFGEGGGVTGEWSGHAIEADGSVFGWDGAEFGGNRSAKGSLATEDLAALLARVMESDFFENEQSERGNMTRQLRITLDGKTHEVSWEPNMDPTDPAAQTSTDKLLAELRKAVKRVE